MTVKSKILGHDVEQLNGQWVFSDTKKPTIDTWKERNCNHCKKDIPSSEHDPCIENLPDVMNACCGHGEDEKAYVQFPNSEVIRGKEAVDFFSKCSKGK